MNNTGKPINNLKLSDASVVISEGNHTSKLVFFNWGLMDILIHVLNTFSLKTIEKSRDATRRSLQLFNVYHWRNYHQRCQQTYRSDGYRTNQAFCLWYLVLKLLEIIYKWGSRRGVTLKSKALWKKFSILKKKKFKVRNVFKVRCHHSFMSPLPEI